MFTCSYVNFADLRTGSRPQPDHVVRRSSPGEVGPPSKPKKSGSGKATKPGNAAPEAGAAAAAQAVTLVATPAAVGGDEFLPDVLQASQGTSLVSFGPRCV